MLAAVAAVTLPACIATVAIVLGRSSGGGGIDSGSGGVYLRGPLDDSSTCSGLDGLFEGDQVTVLDGSTTIGIGHFVQAFYDQGDGWCNDTAGISFEASKAEIAKVARNLRPDGTQKPATATDLEVEVSGYPKVAVTMYGGSTVLFYDPSDDSITYAADQTETMAGHSLPLPD